MNWEAIGAVGEVVGAIAVVATLFFLAVQIRHGRRVQQETNSVSSAAAVDQIFEQFKGWRRLLASDAELAAIWLRGSRGEELEEIERLRFDQFAYDYIVVFSNWSTRSMALGDEERALQATRHMAINLLANPGMLEVWQNSKDSLNPSFVGKVDDLIEENEGGA